ncbi:hypothetical protein ALC62_11054 [Cyphomyrmex costatus]|uniref:Mos1 transposase HTH domain-containing protein n=1 Tax=Cyphomyrmex costatus TaxID=456900 RepID=A0A151ICR7_9HYME|nr:hypothetical protein ALC62_11054 [Cyphomyrmex costatus]
MEIQIHFSISLTRAFRLSYRRVPFLVKLKKNPTECYKLLKEAYGENSLSCARVFEWYKRFSEGRESIEDDQLRTDFLHV